jgi:CBS domain-containing membrane protein
MTEPATQRWRAYLGIETGVASHREKIVSAVGGFVAIFGILVVSQFFVGSVGAQLIIASMGASAVLLFAVPHGPLSQPWSLFGGHLISAVIGVTCARYIGQPLLAASVAVGLAVGAMYYLRCIHPPGGATALASVVGGGSVHALGYQFVVTPVLMNVLIIFVIALAFNYPFAWRRYPAYLGRLAQRRKAGVVEAYRPVEHADFVYALSQLDSFVDVSEDDLLRIYMLATGQAQRRHLMPAQIVLWHAYSNGEQGEDWAVCDIIDEHRSNDPEKDRVIYRVLAGARRRDTGVMTRTEFARWAKYEVVRHGVGWKRADMGEGP